MLLFSLKRVSPYVGSVAPSFVAASVRSRAVAPFRRGEQGQGEDEDNRGSSTNSHSETESIVPKPQALASSDSTLMAKVQLAPQRCPTFFPLSANYRCFVEWGARSPLQAQKFSVYSRTDPSERAAPVYRTTVASCAWHAFARGRSSDAEAKDQVQASTGQALSWSWSCLAGVSRRAMGTVRFQLWPFKRESV